MSDKKLIVGLGNPGVQYENTRHNLGFLVVKYLAEQHRWSFRRSRRCQGLTATGSIAEEPCDLLLPLTFMNNSGRAVRDVLDCEEIALDDLLIVCDDFHLDFGQVRLRLKGSAGGHNGLFSIIEILGTDTFSRLRMGIGTPAIGQDPADFVLENFSRREKKELNSIVEKGAECCLLWLTQKHEKAMNQINKRKKENG